MVGALGIDLQNDLTTPECILHLHDALRDVGVDFQQFTVRARRTNSGAGGYKKEHLLSTFCHMIPKQ